MIRRGRTLLTSRFVRDTFALQVGKVSATAMSFVSTFVVFRLLGPAQYGIYGLALSFLALWQFLDLSGLSTSTVSRMAVAVGAGDEAEVRDLMAFHFELTLLIDVALLILIMLVGEPVADALHGNMQIGDLAAWLALAVIADGIYGLVMTAFQARRSMGVIAGAGVVNQLVLSGSMIVAALVDARPEALVAGRLFYSYSTMILALILYMRMRGSGDFALPSISMILARVGRVPIRPYWRFGVANAIDKNLADWSVQVVVQVVGIFGGERAVGYLNLAMTGIVNVGVLTSAVFENLKAVVPLAVGRQEYTMLWRGIRGAILGLAAGGILVYAVLAIAAPIFIPPLFGDEWVPAIPALIALAPYGVVVTVTGIFGPLYRALMIVRSAIFSKIAGILLVLLPGTLLLLAYLGTGGLNNPEETASVGGAFMFDALFALQGLLTAYTTLPVLRRLAHTQQSGDLHQ